MMSARLGSLLVAGGVVFLGIPSGSLAVAAPASNNVLQTTTLQGASLEVSDGGEAILKLDVPAYTGDPKLQVLNHPNRIVVDLPGVMRGASPSRKDMAAWSSPLIQKTRLAQFVASPAPVTRLVLEVADGVQAHVARTGAGLQVRLVPGSGAVQARLVPPEIVPVVLSAEQRTVAPESPVEAQSVPIVSVSDLAPHVSEVRVSKSSDSMPLIETPSATSSAPVSVSALLPATLSLAQDSPVNRRDDGRGRTLGNTQGKYTGSKITIDVKGAELSTFLRIIADHAKLNLVADQDVQGIYDFKFTDTPWDQVLDIIIKHAGLGMEVNNGVIRVAKVEKLQKEEDDRKKLEESKALAGELTTITRPLSYAKSSEVKGIIEKVLTKRGTLIIDDRTNVLIVSDLPKNLTLVDDLIQQLDVQIQQVQIEARVVEASGSYEKAFGVIWPAANSGNAAMKVVRQDPITGKPKEVDAPWGTHNGYAWNNANNGRTGTPQWMGAYAANNGISKSAGDLWISFLSNRMSVNVILQALEKDGKIRIVSSPKVVTQNNKKATILSGTKIPYPVTQSEGTITIQFADANLELNVTPQITNDGTIIMDLKVEKSEPNWAQGTSGVPAITQRKIETQVLVKDGGTAVLGGVYTTNTDVNSQGIPGLKKIPVFGWLFKNKQTKESNSELLIFITPRILKL